MANFNKIILLGNLTRAAKLSYLPNQTAIVEFSLAVNRNWKGKDGEKKQDVCFIECKAFAKPAETLNKYTKKGDQLLIEGRLSFDSWMAKDGTKRSKHRVIIESFQLMGTKKENSASPDNDGKDDIPF